MKKLHYIFIFILLICSLSYSQEFVRYEYIEEVNQRFGSNKSEGNAKLAEIERKIEKNKYDIKTISGKNNKLKIIGITKDRDRIVVYETPTKK